MTRPLRWVLLALATGANPVSAGASFDNPVVITVPRIEHSNQITAAGVGDLNGDGRTDLVLKSTNHVGLAVSDEDFMIHLHEQGADGVLRLARSLPARTGGTLLYEDWFMGIADLDADGRSEIIQLAGFDLVVLGRNGDGSYSERKRFPLPSWIPLTGGIVHPADIDGDGNLDLLVHANGGVIYLLRGDGAFGFARPTYTLSYGLTWNGDMAVADVDGDGLRDIVTARNTGLGGMGISWGNQSPQRFSEMRSIEWGEGFPSAVAMGDFDNNGRQDIAHSFLQFEDVSLGVIAYHHTISLREVAPDRTLGPPRLFRTGLENPGFTSSHAKLLPADLDGDGDTDLASIQNGGLEVLEWQGDTLTSTRLPTPLPNATFLSGENLMVADLNGDGCLDIGHAQTFYFQIYPGTHCVSSPAGQAPNRRIGEPRATPRPGLPSMPKPGRRPTPRH
jgi:hypothetical protein